MAVKASYKKRYELLKNDHDRLLKEAILAGTMIQKLKKKVYEYEAVLNADDKTKERTFLQQDKLVEKYKELLKVKDETIESLQAKIKELSDKEK